MHVDLVLKKMNNKLRVLYFIFLPIGLFVLPGCEESTDNEPPNIIVTNPSSGESYTAGDTLAVNAEVSDNETIRRVLVRLTDEQGVAVAQNLSFTPNSNPFSINQTYIIDNVDLQSGTYYLAVTAEDEEQQASKFVELQVSSLPLTLERTLVVSSHPDGAEVFQLSEGGSFESLFVYDGDIVGSEISSFSNTVALCGGTSGDLEFRSSIDGTLLSSFDNLSSGGTPWFLDLDYDDDERWFAAGLSNQEVRFYDQEGSSKGTLETQPEFRPYRSWMDDERFFVDERSITQPTVTLRVYQRPGGVFEQSIGLPNPLLGLFDRPSGEKLFFFNDEQNQAQVRLADVQTSLLGQPAELPMGTLNDVIELQPGRYALAIDGTIYRYDYNPSEFILISQTPAEILRYDRDGGAIIASEGNTLRYVDPNSGDVVGTATAPAEILNVLLDYNR